MLEPVVLSDTLQDSTGESGPAMIPRAPLEITTQARTTAPVPIEMPSRPLFREETFSTPLAAAIEMLTPLSAQSRTVPLRIQTFEQRTGTIMPLPAPPRSTKPLRSTVTSLLLITMPWPEAPVRLV